jgi:putative spermidine/putrescine transport system ATP-binding protein
MRLHKNLGVSVVYVTHDQEEALVMSDRIAVFNRGKIDQIGAPSELYERPANRFVADFLGESNFLSGIVKEVRPGYCRMNGQDLSFASRSDGQLEIGQNVVLAVRPERVQLAPATVDMAREDNRATGVVQDVIYLGRSRKYIVKVSDAVELVVLQQAEDSRCAFEVGEAVGISWKSEDSSVFPSE